MTDTLPPEGAETKPAKAPPKDHLRESLLRKAGLTPAQIEEALLEEHESGQQLDQILIAKNFLTEPKTLEMFGDMLGLEYLDSLEGIGVPDDFIQGVPVQFARTHALIAISDEGDVVRVASHRPLDVQPMDDLATLMGRELEAVLAPRAQIANLINRAYRHKADGVDEALQDVKDTDIISIAENIQESEDLLDANKAPVIKLVNMLLFQALKLRASDIHLQPFGDRLQVRMRIDGVLYDMESVPRRAQEAIVSRVKVMGQMDIAERRLPQDGRASIRIGDGDVDVRISTVPVAGGERIVFRILDKTTKVYSLDDIGLDEDAERTIRRYINYSHGVIFVTGPTGSGKTTTLYGCLDEINSPSLNILTIEDPVEYNLDGISQVQVNTKKGLTFASGLRSFLRQDPDIMMVGEVRDTETADIAIRAALTGHLVFSTVHTNDSASTVTRMLDIGVERVPFVPPSFQAISSAVEAVRADAGHLFLTIQRDNPHSASARRRLIEALQSIHEHLGTLDGHEEAAGGSGAGAVAARAAAMNIPDLGAASPDLLEIRELIDELDGELMA
ncbi:MAG TPA: hypothetical protein EYQ80_06390, partial [Candidatus Poseidoniales archaeon]|nr:hypothetical protein [Candidatus Poseidoniales archaeon]